MVEKEKIYKSEKRGLTSRIWFGILTKLCDSVAERVGCGKNFEKSKRKQLTSEVGAVIIAMFRRKWHAPCKLNNVTKRKHQMSRFLWNRDKRELKLRVESITGAEAE